MTERCEPPPEWRFLRYVAVPATEAQREMARQSDLYSRGDMALVWVNEGDLYMPTTPPATVAALVEALEPFASATILPTGAVVGLERGWFDAARAALASAKAEGL